MHSKLHCVRVGAYTFPIVTVLAIIVLLLVGASLSLALDPATITYTNFRDVASIELASTASYFESTTIRATNMIAYSGGTTSSAVENLTNSIVVWTLGNIDVSTTVTGTVMVAADGTWWAEATVPAYSNGSEFYLQTMIVDTNESISYTYEWLKLKNKQAL